MTIVLTILVTLLLCPFLLMSVQFLQDQFQLFFSPGSLLARATFQCRGHIAVSLMAPHIYFFSPLTSVLYISWAANSQRLAHALSRSQYYLLLFFIVVLSAILPVPLGIVIAYSLGLLESQALPIDMGIVTGWAVDLMPQTIVSGFIISGLPYLAYRLSRFLPPGSENRTRG